MSDPRMKALTQGLPTKSAKIRKLGAAGYTRQQIADFLGIRYQHVRNVLLDAERKTRAETTNSEGLAEEPAPPPAPGARQIERLTIAPDGSVPLPLSMRAAAGFAPGDVIMGQVAGNGEIHLLSRVASAERARAALRKHIPPGVDLMEELRKERQLQADREERLFKLLTGE
jgi:hypothetical protein